MPALAITVCGALGWWLGVEAIRAFLATMIWNVAEDVPATQLAIVGLAFWLVGLAGWLPARIIGRARSAVLFGALFAVLSFARQAVVDETLTAALAIAGLIAFLWWLPAFIHAVARRGATRLLAPALLLGSSVQLAGQVALNGLDLHAFSGLPSALATGAVATAFGVALLALQRGPERPGRPPGWAALAVMPWAFVQLTLTANIGRLEALGGWDVPVAGLVGGAGLVAAAMACGWWSPGPRAGLVVIVGAGALMALATLGGAFTLLLIPAQAGLAVLLGAALGGSSGEADAGQRDRTWLGAAIGGLAFFVLLFALYSDTRDGLGVAVWPVAAAVLSLPALLARRPAVTRPVGRPWLSPALIAALSLLALAAGGLPAAGERAPGPAPAELRILNLNIHQGFGRNGVADLPRTLAAIRAADADVITLQEVPRVWDLSGGVDTFAWLSARLSDYYAVFGPTSRARFGNAILSRYPLSDSGFVQFPIGEANDQRGFAWAVVGTAAGPLLVATPHLQPYDRADEATERDAQAGLLLDFWQTHGRSTAVFFGDYNGPPDSAAIQRTLAGGLEDGLAKAGLGSAPTFRSTGSLFLPPSVEQIDYLFVSPGVVVRSARILDADVSDHYPIVAEVSLP